MPPFDEIFHQIKVNFLLLGIPFDSDEIYSRFYILLFSLTMTVLQEIGFFISNSSAENFLDMTKLAPCTCIGILSIIKLIIIVFKRHKVFKLTDCLKNLYVNILKDDEKKKLIRQNFVFLKFLTKYHYILNGGLIIVYNFSTLIIVIYRYTQTGEVIYNLPYSLYVPFSIDSWATWSAVYLYSACSGFICVLYFITVDALYYIMSTHISSHFMLLSTEVLKLDGENSYLLKNIVKKHQYLLKLSEDIDDIFTGPNFFNVLIGSLEICALGFNLTMGEWTQIPGVVLFLFSVLLQIFMMSVFGENLIRESLRVGEAAFLCNWNTMGQNSKKIILQLIQSPCKYTCRHIKPRWISLLLKPLGVPLLGTGLPRRQICGRFGVYFTTLLLCGLVEGSSKPQKLTAYKFSTISYESFIKIMSRSWSYFTILKTVYKPPEGTHY